MRELGSLYTYYYNTLEYHRKMYTCSPSIIISLKKYGMLLCLQFLYAIILIKKKCPIKARNILSKRLYIVTPRGSILSRKCIVVTAWRLLVCSILYTVNIVWPFIKRSKTKTNTMCIYYTNLSS